MKRALGYALSVSLCLACSRRPPSPAATASSPTVDLASGGLAESPTPMVTPASSPSKPAQAAPGDGTLGAKREQEVGAPKSFDNLTIFPVTSTSQQDLGPLTTLDEALANKTAAVHEVGAEANGRGDGAQVNSLVIENKGTIPIYVLAGTIVKGGKQDRQIGDDFIVGANQAVPVDAFCVEHGRWVTDRDGVQTGGQFGVVGLLTDSRVRAAGQYEHDQSDVWSKVAEVNAANKKEAASGTLMATVDAADVTARRAALAKKVDGFLNGGAPDGAVVGFAYAVDGQVRSARWFANHRIFELFRRTLSNTAAMDAITAAAASGAPLKAAPPMAATDVTTFVDDVKKAAVKEERATPAMNVNDVQESSQGYGSSVMLKGGPTTLPRKVSSDFSKK